ncbi:MAG: hypothetical protein K2O65_14510 [Lachnospiraceae bacterium]|nr:hypothetical protein [Lachnospiraceae bacterium]
MDEISMKKALEAYNTIREYCKEHANCEGCVFLRKDGEKKSYSCDEPCIFGVGFYPHDWD